MILRQPQATLPPCTPPAESGSFGEAAHREPASFTDVLAVSLSAYSWQEKLTPAGTLRNDQTLILQPWLPLLPVNI